MTIMVTDTRGPRKKEETKSAASANLGITLLWRRFSAAAAVVVDPAAVETVITLVLCSRIEMEGRVWSLKDLSHTMV
jgi:hypothetical protein